jgi:tetratricopeptide (TPR) repeat protein
MGQGRLDEAKVIFKPLLQKRGDVAEIHFNYALLLKQKKQWQGALSSLEQASALRPTMVTAWYHLADTHIRLSNTDEAVKHFKKTLEIDPSFTRAYLG